VSQPVTAPARRAGPSAASRADAPAERTAVAGAGDAARAADRASSFAKGLFVLETLVEAARPLSLAGLVERTGLPKTTVHRIVSVLVERGWAKAGAQGYGLGYLPLRAAAAFEASLDIRLESEPFLVALRNDLDETVHLATLDHELRVVYIEKLVPRFQAIGLMRSRVGSTAPAHCTGVGKAMLACLPEPELAGFLAQDSFTSYTPRTITRAEALLADLEQVRARGYAICDEEHEAGVSCIAAAIRGRRGEPVAAISLSGPAERMVRHLRDNSGSALAVRDAAAAISLRIGGTGHGTGVAGAAAPGTLGAARR
jgi:DNA-binding IclR family transcriptional regulator